MTHKAKVVIVAAMSKKGRAIGYKNQLLWHIPDDMKRFKEKTGNHPIILGRKTFESILKILGKPLPGRQNIVVTRNEEYTYPDVLVTASLEEAFAKAQALDSEEIHIGGGTEIYKQALPFVDTLNLTFVDDEPEADTFFPEFENDFVVTQIFEPQIHNGLLYQWVDYVRK
jgi:dihydrofolate reductase